MSMFRVGVSRDFLDAEGTNVWGDIGLARLDEEGIPWEYLPETVAAFSPADLEPYDAVIFAAPAVTADSFAEGVRRPRLLARFGVGYDTVDLEACTHAGVAVTITPDGARRPVALAALSLVLAVQHNLVVKDRLVREGRWPDRVNWMGHRVTGATIGLIGLGNTGGELVRLLQPLGASVLAHDPHCPAERASGLGVELVDLPTLALRADVVVVMCALTPETFHLVDAAFLALMKPDSALVNVARGPIVDEHALIAALESGTIRAAGLDVFEEEPQTSGIERLTNVTLAPHSLAWTAEMSRGNGESCVQAVLDMASGRIPQFVVNRAVFEEPMFTTRLEPAS